MFPLYLQTCANFWTVLILYEWNLSHFSNLSEQEDFRNVAAMRKLVIQHQKDVKVHNKYIL